MAEWEATRWWRAVLPDGSVWCESSSEAEVREAATEAPQQPATVERLMRRTEQRWQPV